MNEGRGGKNLLKNVSLSRKGGGGKKERKRKKGATYAIGRTGEKSGRERFPVIEEKKGSGVGFFFF